MVVAVGGPGGRLEADGEVGEKMSIQLRREWDSLANVFKGSVMFLTGLEYLEESNLFSLRVGCPLTFLLNTEYTSGGACWLGTYGSEETWLFGCLQETIARESVLQNILLYRIKPNRNEVSTERRALVILLQRPGSVVLRSV